MNSSLLSLLSVVPSNPHPGAESTEGRFAEDDIPLGCECANPALQIERWGQEIPGSTQHSY